jgi:hypothetical protein
MMRGMEVLRRMFILGGIAASDMPAFQAQAQMDPTVAHFEALLAAASVRFHVLYLIDVRAGLHITTLNIDKASRKFDTAISSLA